MKNLSQKLVLFFICLGFLACSKGAAPFVGTPSIIVLPTTATLGPGQTQQFTATIYYTSTSVIWSVDGGSANGTIDQTGLYTAPATITQNSTAVVRASLSNNTSTQDTSTVDLTTTPPSP